MRLSPAFLIAAAPLALLGACDDAPSPEPQTSATQSAATWPPPGFAAGRMQPPAPPQDGPVIPVAGVGPARLTDTFNQVRAAGARLHDAIDIPAPRGTPVLAAAPGLTEGARVAAGEVLGTVGVSGNADPAAPHLHFALIRTRPDAPWHEAGTALNPYPWLRGQQAGATGP